MKKKIDHPQRKDLDWMIQAIKHFPLNQVSAAVFFLKHLQEGDCPNTTLDGSNAILNFLC